MKQIIIAIITVAAALAQICLIGINGLTLISVPLTIFLGLEVIDRTTK